MKLVIDIPESDYNEYKFTRKIIRADKLITSKESIELEIDGVTLLTTEEAKALPREQIKIGDDWWLRSPGYNVNNAAFVDGEAGFVYDYGYNVSKEFGVRPALQISNLQSSNLEIGDRFDFADYSWTVIAEDKALCDDIIGYSAFRKDWKAKDANDYEKSDIKKYLEDWWREAQNEDEDSD